MAYSRNLPAPPCPQKLKRHASYKISFVFILLKICISCPLGPSPSRAASNTCRDNAVHYRLTGKMPPQDKAPMFPCLPLLRLKGIRVQKLFISASSCSLAIVVLRAAAKVLSTCPSAESNAELRFNPIYITWQFYPMNKE